MSDIVEVKVEALGSNGELVIGKHCETLLEHVPTEARTSVLNASLRVLERAASTAQLDRPATSAQLVVGEVQSGKTLSFTTVMALARDNKYPLLIVVAGTKNNLLSQTEVRLNNDLRLNGDGGANPWRAWKNPTVSDADGLRQLLAQWSDPSIPDRFRQTAVIFVLKHAGRLEALAETLNTVFREQKCPTVKTLIIDDEADQASLNIKATKGEESSVYSAARKMREALSNHTYLMYTATPQAPLLVSITDTLSPDYVTVLTAGSNYVGGKDLFEKHRRSYIRTIEAADLETALDPDSESPPDSLIDALAFWTLALVVSQERERPRPFTMLVHPAHTRDLHAKYDSWVRRVLDGWKIALSDQSDIAYEDLLTSVFLKAYNDLRSTVTGYEDPAVDRTQLDEMLKLARFYLNQIEQRVVNSETLAEIPEEEWRRYPGWIVIGGNKLDRGFTVQNLGVTYMPRGKGVGNVDTIQQRGRFFGYKRPYLDLLRGWFSTEVARAFRSYVEHERTMQAQLRTVDADNSSLKEWRRKFLLDPDLHLTRRQVMSLPTVSSVVGRGWAFRQLELYESGLQVKNCPIASSLIELVETRGHDHPSDHRPTESKHRIMQIEFESAIELLYAWECSPLEREELDKVLFLLSGILDEKAPMPGIDFVAIDGGKPRRRGLSKTGGNLRITNLFQGRGSTGGYIGDDGFRESDRITIQLHMVTLKDAADYESPVPALAVALPEDSQRRIYWGAES